MLVLNYFCDDGLGSLLFTEGWVNMIQVTILWVHQKYPCCVIYVIAILLIFRLVDFLLVNFKPFHDLSQLRVIWTRCSHSDHILVEVRQKFLNLFGRISLRVDGDKYKFQFQVGSFRNIPDDSVHSGDVIEGTGADIRATSEAKINKVVISWEVIARKGFTLGVNKSPVSSNLRFILFEFFESWDLLLIEVEVLLTLFFSPVNEIEKGSSHEYQRHYSILVEGIVSLAVVILVRSFLQFLLLLHHPSLFFILRESALSLGEPKSIGFLQVGCLGSSYGQLGGGVVKWEGWYFPGVGQDSEH